MRGAIALAALWMVLTADGEMAVLSWDLMPLAAAEEAATVDDAFRALLALAVPVLTFVIVVLGYSLLRFRSRTIPAQDGPPIRTHSGVVAVWFLVTGGLTILMIVHPGVTGVRELSRMARQPPDLVVKVDAMQFAWRVRYPEQNVTVYTELVLPVDRRVRFEVTSEDVIHSFWVPVFRMKIDAVPGRVTTTHATPNIIGESTTAGNFRLVCAELCGVGHSIMAIPVRVVGQSDFDAWVDRQAKLTNRS